jgi:hypothetical protein
MKKRMEFWQVTETVISSADDSSPRPSLLRRILGFIGKTVFYFLVSFLPILLTYEGVCGLFTGKMVVWSRILGAHVTYGDEALGLAWIHIAVGVFWLGWVMEEFTGRPILKWIVWAIGSGLVINGIRLIIKSM